MCSTDFKLLFLSENEPAGEKFSEDEVEQTELEGSDQNDELAPQEEVLADIAEKRDGMTNYPCLPEPYVP